MQVINTHTQRKQIEKYSPQGQIVGPMVGSETCILQFSERPAEARTELAAAPQLTPNRPW